MINSKIKALKVHLGGRMSSVNSYDANAARQIASPQGERPMYTNRLVVSYASRKIQILANEELGCVSVSGDFDVSPFTINAGDRIGFKSVFAGDVRMGPREYAVFTKDGRLTASQRNTLHFAEVATLIRSHRFRTGEALHFYRNGLILYVRKEDLSSELVFLLLALANSMPPEDSGSAEIELPPEFSHLENLTRDWAIGDDVVRTDKIDDASESQLKEFLALVEPELGAINSYLERLGEYPPGEAVANLANLIETALEVKDALMLRSAPRHPLP